MHEEEMRIEEAAQQESEEEMRIDGEAAQPEMRMEEAAQPWADLVPTDVLRLVALRLPPSDFSNFQKICRPWRCLPMESYPLGRSPLYLFSRHGCFGEAKDFGDREKLYLYSPLYNTTFSWAASREVLDIYNSKSSMYSKDGWLVFFTPQAVVFVNPFLHCTTAPAVIKWMTSAQYSNNMMVVSMSAPPTDPACILLLMKTSHYGIEIVTGSEGGTNWKVDSFDFRGASGYMCSTSPVFHGDVFYCLMRRGALGIYNPRRRTWDARYLPPEHCLGIRVSGHNVLVESNGELLNVFWYGDHQTSGLPNPIVYMLNESSREWKKLTDLRGRALFLDWRSALSTVAEVNGMKDRIFYSKFDCTAAVKVECELHRSADGDLRLVPRSRVGLAKLARRVKEELVGISLPYSMEGACEEADRECWRQEVARERWCQRNGCWFRPMWDNNDSII